MSRILKFRKSSASRKASTSSRKSVGEAPDAFAVNIDDITAEILSYLELEDRKNASLINQTWRKAFLYSESLGDCMITVIDESMGLKLVPVLRKARTLKISKAPVDHPQHFQLLYTIIPYCNCLTKIILHGDKFGTPETGWPTVEILDSIFEEARPYLANVKTLVASNVVLDVSSHLHRLLGACVGLQKFRAEIDCNETALTVLLNNLNKSIRSVSIDLCGLQNRGLTKQLNSYTALAKRGIQLRRLELFTNRRFFSESFLDDSFRQLFDKHPGITLVLTERQFAERFEAASVESVRRVLEAVGSHLEGLHFVWPVNYPTLEMLPYDQLKILSCEYRSTSENDNVPSDVLIAKLGKAATLTATGLQLRRLTVDAKLLDTVFLEKAANLRELNISKWRVNSLNLELVSLIARNLPLLRKLSLPTKVPQLCLFTESPEGNHEFKHLECLDVGKCIDTDKFATEFQIYAPKLKHLSLTLDTDLVAVINAAWHSVFRNCSYLSTVSTISNSRNNPDWWASLTKLKGIRHVSVVELMAKKQNRCTLCRSSKSLNHIRSCKSLRCLDVSYCYETIKDLLSIHSCSGCASIFENASKNLRFRVPCQSAGFVDLTS